METSDPTAVGTYPLILLVQTPNAASEAYSSPFKVVIEPNCNSATITPTATIPTQNYDIGTP